MSKLNAMHIQNFRGLTDVSLNNFSKINVFVGENNAGKTSLLEAIYFVKPLRINSITAPVNPLM